MGIRPYTRAMHPDDYNFLQSYVDPLYAFVQDMAAHNIPHREWHGHRLWEYASIMQQLMTLGVQHDAEMVDVGAGASFFDPYLALLFPNLCCTDSMKYGDVTEMVTAQKIYYAIDMPLHDASLEDMSMFRDGRFDVTMCISTIEHVDNHDKAFAELVRITKPGGYLFLTSDYFRNRLQWEASPSRSLQVTPYTKAFVLDLPNRFPVTFVGETDLDYCGDFVHNYSFCNMCLKKCES